MNTKILEIDHLHVDFKTFEGTFSAIHNVSLAVNTNESIGIIGESGCGKSTLGFSIMRYLDSNASVRGAIHFKGNDMFQMSEHELSRIRGNRIAMVFQNPSSALNPARTIGFQLDEVGIRHQHLSKAAAKEASIEALSMLNIGDPHSIVQRYPHQVSGGIQQRICIAMALLCRPDLMILDEPTTALDVTTEAVILDSVAQLRDKLNMSMLYISHDMGVINKVADTIVVMYNGEIVEKGPKEAIFEKPLHPYTRALINCMPRGGVVKEHTRLNTIRGYVKKRGVHESGCPYASRCDKRNDTCEALYRMREIEPGRLAACDRAYAQDVKETKVRSKKPIQHKQSSHEQLLRLNHVHKTYAGRKKVYAVNGVDMSVTAASVVGIVGESGCGKSTTGHMVAGLYPPTSGSLYFEDQDISMPWNKRTKEQLRLIQLIFQNPGRSLNPSHTVEHIIARPLKRLAEVQSKKQRRKQILQLLKRVDLGAEYLEKKPSQLSGGEQQRVAIARVLSIAPSLIVFDEPTSALDVSVQASVLNLLNELQAQTGATYLFISHDLNVVNYISDYIMVMYAGRICEYGTRDEVTLTPKHPYTEVLLSAVPEVDPNVKRKAIVLDGQLPDPTKKVTGCPFASRCHKKVGPICDEMYPPTVHSSENHYYNCHISG